MADQATQTPASPSAKELRRNLKKLSSGINTSSTAETEISGKTHLSNEVEQVFNVVSSLNQALLMSQRAIDSLERIAAREPILPDLSFESINYHEGLNPRARPITHLDEVTHLHRDMCCLLEQLKLRIETAHIMNQNLHASEVSLDNLSKAQLIAKKLGINKFKA